MVKAEGQPNKPKYYVGQTMSKIKERILKVESDMGNPKMRHTMALSTYIWGLKDEEKEYKVSWKIFRKARVYSKKTNRCNLCIADEVVIMEEKQTIAEKR